MAKRKIAQASGWQPIATAPNEEDSDGAVSGLIVWSNGVQMGWLMGTTWVDAQGLPIQPTHWMPLPAPPEAE